MDDIKSIIVIHECIKSKEDQDKFVIKVNNALYGGWKLYGELQVTSRGPEHGVLFTQRMAKFNNAD